jgi:hypothetical protein
MPVWIVSTDCNVSIAHCKWIIQNIPCQMAQFKEQAVQGFYKAAAQ